MKFTLKWLSEHIEIDQPLDKIIDSLNEVGLEVEQVDDPKEKFKQFVVAEVIEAKKLQNSDKLWHCHVLAQKKAVEIVCGAPNVKVGMKAVYAPPGSYIPGRGIYIEKVAIRGVTSHGMLCSELELQISKEHDNIIELPKHAEAGQTCHQYLHDNDTTIDVGVTINRGDCLGVRGIARELAAAGLGKIKTQNIQKIKPKFQCPIAVKIKFDENQTKACYQYAGIIVKNVKNGEAPDWLKNRLLAVGLRPNNAIADITNYINYDLARPLHAFDADKINGDIQIRYAKKGESIDALNNRCYQIDQQDCVIADDKSVLALGGVIGGIPSSVDASTKTVFIESALFDPQIIAKTGRRHAIVSDACQRFERGVDPQSVMKGIEKAVTMITDICGGQASSIVVDGIIDENNKKIIFDYREIKRLTGVQIEPQKVNEILANLEFRITKHDKEQCELIVPSFRYDVDNKADIVEEVVRIYGLDKIAVIPLPQAPIITQPRLDKNQIMTMKVRRLAAARGFIEIVSWSMVAADIAAKFDELKEELLLQNPISKELSAMRQNLMIGLLNATAKNERHGQRDFGLFEMGQCFDGLQPQNQSLQLAAIRCGSAKYARNGRDWQYDNTELNGFDLKNDVEAIICALGYSRASLKIIPTKSDWYHPGYSGNITIGGKKIVGRFGMLHPVVLHNFSIKQPVGAFELLLSELPIRKKSTRAAKEILQKKTTIPIRRDLAFVVKKSKPAGEVLTTLLRAERKYVGEVRLFDVYQGEGLDSDEKSLAFEVTLMSDTPTPTDSWIKEILQNLITNVEKYCSGRLRQ